LLLLVEDAATKVHGRYTEILYSPKGQELIEFWFRQVDTDAPNFKTLYQNIMINLRFDCNNIQVVCHRTVIVNFLTYVKGITDNLSISNKNELPDTEKHVEETKKNDLLKDSAPLIIRPDSKENYLIKNNDFENQVDEELIQGSTIRESAIAPEKDVQINIETEEERNKCTEALDLAIQELIIVFCDESAIELQPLAEIKIMLDAQVSNWTKNLHVKAGLALEATYFNDNLSNWEPLIENVMEKEDQYRPWNLKVWFCMEPGTDLNPPKAKEKLNFKDFDTLVQPLDYSLLESQLKSI
jgi:hypothetical protein